VKKHGSNPMHPDAPREALARLVKLSSLTQKAIGESVGLSETDMSKVMKGTHKLDTPTLVRVMNELSKADGVTWDDFTELADRISRSK